MCPFCPWVDTTPLCKQSPTTTNRFRRVFNVHSVTWFRKKCSTNSTLAFVRLDEKFRGNLRQFWLTFGVELEKKRERTSLHSLEEAVFWNKSSGVANRQPLLWRVQNRLKTESGCCFC